MNGPITIKICGLSTPETLEAALDAGADMVGLVFHPRSPRFVSDNAARAMADQARGRARVVALVVDLDNARLDAIAEAVKPDWWQLHGGEDADRAREIRTRHGLPVIKAIGWSTGDAQEHGQALSFEHAADRLLLDARPPRDAAYPGGHGQPFDWTTLKALAPVRPHPGGVGFILAGGLYPHNVADAIRTVRGLGCDLKGVDVSSGVESAPGVKDASKIRDFIAAARAAARDAAQDAAGDTA
jgi:phosphoribosylanthranilate isomerase